MAEKPYTVRIEPTGTEEGDTLVIAKAMADLEAHGGGVLFYAAGEWHRPDGEVVWSGDQPPDKDASK